MEIRKIRIEDFPLLFGSSGLCRDAIEQFTKILKQFDLLIQESIELQKEVVDISDKAKWWLEKDLSAEATNYYSKGINEASPKDQEFDTTYQERYAIGSQFVSGRKNCNEKMQECLEMCNEPDRLLKSSILETKNVVELTLKQLLKLNSLAEKIHNNLDSPDLALKKTTQMQMISLLGNTDIILEKYHDNV